LSLQVTPAPYQLPAGIAREVVLSRGSGLLVLGGITNSGATTSAVTKLDPVTGRASAGGQLAVPTHDAAGAVLNGQPLVFGGGSANSIAAVQALAGRHIRVASQLPQVRSDLSAVTLGGTAYLVGGYDGATWNPWVLATANGAAFHTVARLPVPVRYAAVAGVGNHLWVFGGEVPAGFTNVIQQVDLGSGKASVVGHLPMQLSAATAFTLGSQVFLAGGATAGNGPASSTVFAYDPARRRVHAAGSLPVPVSNAAAAVMGGTAFLVGGSDGPHLVPTVTEMRLVSVAAAVTPGASPVGATVLADPPGGEGSGGTDPGSPDESAANAEPAGRC
jgi:N-acetylneuraminic acid mutarotase